MLRKIRGVDRTDNLVDNRGKESRLDELFKNVSNFEFFQKWDFCVLYRLGQTVSDLIRAPRTHRTDIADRWKDCNQYCLPCCNWLRERLWKRSTCVHYQVVIKPTIIGYRNAILDARTIPIAFLNVPVDLLLARDPRTGTTKIFKIRTGSGPKNREPSGP